MEIPHFGSMRGKERELIVLRSDNGDTWKEHQFDISPEDLTELITGMDEGKGEGSQHNWKFTSDGSFNDFHHTIFLIHNVKGLF